MATRQETENAQEKVRATLLRSSAKHATYTGGTLPDGFAGCSCAPTHLRWHYCSCGARQRYNETVVREIKPALTAEQIEAMTALDSAIPIRMANRVGYDMRKLGLSTGINRSGDNAEVLSQLGEAMQRLLRGQETA